MKGGDIVPSGARFDGRVILCFFETAIERGRPLPALADCEGLATSANRLLDHDPLGDAQWNAYEEVRADANTLSRALERLLALGPPDPEAALRLAAELHRFGAHACAPPARPKIGRPAAPWHGVAVQFAALIETALKTVGDKRKATYSASRAAEVGAAMVNYAFARLRPGISYEDLVDASMRVLGGKPAPDLATPMQLDAHDFAAAVRPRRRAKHESVDERFPHMARITSS